MKRYYSQTTGSTYLPAVHAEVMPSDAVLIDEGRYLEVIGNPAAGMVRSHDAYGLPTLVHPPAPAAEQIWQKIKTERERLRFNGGVKVGTHWYLSTAVAGSEYTSLAVISVGMPDETILRKDWRTMDGAVIDMTPPLVKQILAAGFFAIAAIDDAAQAHKLAMEASAVPSEYDFTGGWPEVFVATPIEE